MHFHVFLNQFPVYLYGEYPLKYPQLLQDVIDVIKKVHLYLAILLLLVLLMVFLNFQQTEACCLWKRQEQNQNRLY